MMFLGCYNDAFVPQCEKNVLKTPLNFVLTGLLRDFRVTRGVAKPGKVMKFGKMEWNFISSASFKVSIIFKYLSKGI